MVGGDMDQEGCKRAATQEIGARVCGIGWGCLMIILLFILAWRMHHIDIQLSQKSPPCNNKFKISISSYKKNMKISKTKATGIQDPDMLHFTENVKDIKDTKEGFLSHRFSSIGIDALPLPRCNKFMESTRKFPQSQNLQKSWSGNKKSEKSKKKPKVKQSLDKEAQKVNVVQYGPGDTLKDKYRLEKLIGKGSFGDVYSAIDLQSNERVSVKLVANLKKFQNFVEQEIRFLTQLSQKEEYGRFIVQIKESFKVDNIYCIVMQLLSVNLFDCLKESEFRGLALPSIRKIAIQLFIALHFVRKHHIIHADIKPENLLLKEKGKLGVKLIDFGTSVLDTDNCYDYIMSRYYRAPEIMLGHSYDCSVDMWSAACLLMELFIGLPFFPGQNEEEQIYLMVKTLGNPPVSFLKKCRRAEAYFQPNGELRPKMLKKYTVASDCAFTKRVPNQGFGEFIRRIMQWVPSDRMTPAEALEDQWILQGISPVVVQQIKNTLGSDSQMTSRRILNHLKRQTPNSKEVAEKRESPYMSKTTIKPRHTQSISLNKHYNKSKRLEKSK